jgi:hypothetical protein
MGSPGKRPGPRRASVSRNVPRKVYLDQRPLSTGGKIGSAFARDDGRCANDPLRYWFDNLTNSNGKCSSFADGLSISDVEWDTEDGHYRVLLHGE